MPLLPSGLMVGITNSAIPLQPTNFGYCPSGYFICYIQDQELSGPPPYKPGQVLQEIPVAMPLPENFAQLARFIKVGFVNEEGVAWWSGEWLSDFPRYIRLDAADTLAWEAWLQSNTAQEYLNEFMHGCLNQSRYIEHIGGGNSDGEIWLRNASTNFDSTPPYSYPERLVFLQHYFIRQGLPVPQFLNQQEIHAMGVEAVARKVEELGFQIERVNLAWGTDPQILARRDVRFGVFFVRADFYPYTGGFDWDEYQDLITLAESMGAEPYMAGVRVMRRAGQTAEEKGLPIVGEEHNASFFGIWSMARDGHEACLDVEDMGGMTRHVRRI